MASFTEMDLSDNGSFQNQPPSASALAKKRRRGVTCVLTEVDPNESSIEPARMSKTAAEAKIKEGTSNLKCPRGDSSLGGKIKWAKENRTSLPNETQAAEEKQDISTLQKLLKTHPEVFKSGSEFVDGYFERNTVLEIQKACAIKVFN